MFAPPFSRDCDWDSKRRRKEVGAQKRRLRKRQAAFWPKTPLSLLLLDARVIIRLVWCHAMSPPRHEVCAYRYTILLVGGGTKNTRFVAVQLLLMR